MKIVYDSLEDESLEKLSYCDASEIDPQIWFRDKSGRECWLKVLYAAYPEDVYSLKFSYDGWHEQALAHEGYLARVGFMDADGRGKLYRTKGANVNFRGIEHIYFPS